MTMFRGNFRVLGIATIFVVLPSLIGTNATAATKEIPAWFNYKISPGVIVGGAAKTYVPIGKPYGIKYTISNVENSGPGSITFRLFSDGTPVWTQVVNVTANGTFTKAEPAPKFLKGEKHFGPFYLCTTSRTATGAKEVRSPCSKWSWIPIEVPIALVSNGCAGETGIAFLKKVESGWLDKQMIGGMTFDFRDACNVLDAAYRGLTVTDPSTKKVMDFSLWKRQPIDMYFQFDIQMICMKVVSASDESDFKKGTTASSCSNWALRYFNAIRAVGFNFFDANPAKPGVQRSYVEPDVLLGLPASVGRDNS
ncbi:MAG: hypothetical protein Q8K86_04560 [Candidatus Nanopelagicaceae bacterium]|nr:hypothetical protein [Candidatus Nanopelagicaceae bacterium]